MAQLSSLVVAVVAIIVLIQQATALQVTASHVIYQQQQQQQQQQQRPTPVLAQTNNIIQATTTTMIMLSNDNTTDQQQTGLTTDQEWTLQIIVTFSSVLSVLGSMFVIFCYIRLREFTIFHLRLILNLAITDCFGYGTSSYARVLFIDRCLLQSLIVVVVMIRTMI
jgi:hypothetical protein